jgi:hypothetical protein
VKGCLHELAEEAVSPHVPSHTKAPLKETRASTHIVRVTKALHMVVSRMQSQKVCARRRDSPIKKVGAHKPDAGGYRVPTPRHGYLLSARGILATRGEALSLNQIRPSPYTQIDFHRACVLVGFGTRTGFPKSPVNDERARKEEGKKLLSFQSSPPPGIRSSFHQAVSEQPEY